MSNTAYKEYISKLETLYDTVVKSSADGYYEGERNNAGQPHGFGTMHYPIDDSNGRDNYIGEWKNGKRYGKGKLIWLVGATYEGDWKDDFRDGYGKYSVANDFTYEGGFKKGKRHGKGITIDGDGLYEGEWDEDELIWQYASYPVVKIGKQIWMTKNLDVESFRNGDPIPHITSDEEWEEYGKQGKPAWCYYDNRKAIGEKYGKLYNWYAVNDPRGLAPKGWKVPSDDEWTQLTDYLGGEDVAGEKMKSTSGWNNSEGKSFNGNNRSGFSGLPGGYRTNDGAFDLIGTYGGWWGSTESLTDGAWYRGLNYSLGVVYRCYDDRKSGYSVRCLRD
jgi:uncharacterized protein (TIGR02145 family)